MALNTDKIDDAALALLYLTLHDGVRAAEAQRVKAEAKPIVTIAACDGFRNGSTHPTS